MAERGDSFLNWRRLTSRVDQMSVMVSVWFCILVNVLEEPFRDSECSADADSLCLQNRRKPSKG